MKRLSLYGSFMLILFVFAAGNLAAQDDATARFIDSASKPEKPAPVKISPPTEAIDTVVANENVVDSSEEELPLDTAIVSKLRVVNTDTFSLLKKDKGFYYQSWLDSLLRAEEAKMKPPPQPKDIKMPNLDLFFTIFETILWVLAGAVVLFIIYKLFLSNSALFVRNRKNIDVAVDTEESVKDANHYDGLLRKAEASGNYRLAVRFLHLQALYSLSERGSIVFGTDKTNYQYINELRKSRPTFVNAFSALTNKYEYIWYGEYPIAVEKYNVLKNEFVSFNNQVTAG